MRVRVSVRWLMVLVAISALAVGPAYRYLRVLWLRSQDYAASARIMRVAAAGDSRLARISSGRPEAVKAAKRSAAWHAERAAVYERASWRPWTIVPNEPPPPLLPPETFVRREPMPKFEFSPAPKPPAEMTETEKKQERVRRVEEVKAYLDQLKQRGSRRRAALEAELEAAAK